MSQLIEAPNTADIDSVAKRLIHAGDLAKSVGGREFTGHESDLDLLQQVLDSRQLKPEATYSLQALGLAFGNVFIENHNGYDWWMVEDEYGRDPAVRYRETSLLVFPLTMISKRVEDGELVDVRSLYQDLQQRLEALRREGHADA